MSRNTHVVAAAIVERAIWLTRDELAGRRAEHRSPALLACIDDYLAGRRYPLELVRHL